MLNSNSTTMSSISATSAVNNSFSTPPIDGVDGQTSWIVFWCSAALCMIAAVISILGNGLVLYVSILNKDIGRFRYVNLVVKNLALCDFLFGLVGTPMTTLFWYWGKNISIIFIFYIIVDINLPF